MTDAAKLEGRIYDLSQEMFLGMPITEPNKPGFLFALYRRHGDGFDQPPPKTSAGGLLIMPEHSGTHIDGLTHIAYDMTFHGGIPVKSTETPHGYSALGMETVRPIVCPGVLLDMTKELGDPLPDRHVISLTEARRCIEQSAISISRGTAVLLRTGFDRYWSNPEKYWQAPGVSREVSQWIAEQRVRVVGADNPAWDLMGAVDSATGLLHVGHQLLIYEHGIHIIENLDLQELSRDQCYSFTFVCLPLKVRGGTGCPIRPIALPSD